MEYTAVHAMRIADRGWAFTVQASRPYTRQEAKTSNFALLYGGAVTIDGATYKIKGFGSHPRGAPIDGSFIILIEGEPQEAHQKWVKIE